MMRAAPWPAMALFLALLALNLWLAGMPDWRWVPAVFAAWYIVYANRLISLDELARWIGVAG